eukprot:TRINITY_DN1994_c1_g1_i1.p1 TRINITY_DN1994_c1_g1~~TRINITY_DN1994_c1_g1_i1.p1  ORF type:complete len:520 (+),score=142.89 TRINITY_DN1994_c1_g1_i1:26-1585(+)
MSSSDGDDYLEPHILESYDVQELLGKGAYGVVWRVIDKVTEEVFALKKVFKAFQNSTDSQRTYREVMLLRQLKHDRIIGIEKIIKAENEEDLYIVFPYMDSDMHYAIRTGILEEDHKRFLVYQMLTALLFIHSAGVIHRDIKPENMLIDTSCALKVADFGLARCFDENEDEENYPMTDYVATRWYRAPEILFGSTVYTKAVDMWAVGCIVAELYGERPIFPGKSTIDQLARIMEITGRPSEEELEPSLSPQFISQMMNNLPRVITRSLASMYPQCDETAIDFMERCFKFNPSERMTVEEALSHPYLEDFRDTDEEILASKKINIPIEDNVRQKTEDYKRALYKLCEHWEIPDEDIPAAVENAKRKKSKTKSSKEVTESEFKSSKKSKKSEDDERKRSHSKKELSKTKRSQSKKELTSSSTVNNKKKVAKPEEEPKKKSRRGDRKMKRSATQGDAGRVKRRHESADTSKKEPKHRSKSRKRDRTTNDDSKRRHKHKKREKEETGEKKKRRHKSKHTSKKD